jgi:hypothetical protein
MTTSRAATTNLELFRDPAFAIYKDKKKRPRERERDATREKPPERETFR